MHCTRHRVSIPMTVLGGLQFHRHRGLAYARVTVSIPMTVLGGLQYAIDSAVSLGTSVSIPMTVLGGLQSFGPWVDFIELCRFQYR